MVIEIHSHQVPFLLQKKVYLYCVAGDGWGVREICAAARSSSIDLQ